MTQGHFAFFGLFNEKSLCLITAECAGRDYNTLFSQLLPGIMHENFFV